jgi:NADH:ubiquinone oxidoreductase subunit K
MSGILLLRRNALGYLFTFPLLILCIIIGVIVIAQTISQTLVGIIFPVGVYIGMIGSWVVMGGFAIVFTLNLLRNIRE